MSTLRKLLRRLRRDEGSVTVEFVILFPMFMVLLISSIEAGVLLTRQMMLERGLDITMRQVRLGLMEDPSFERVKAELCRQTGMIPDCLNTVMLELSPVDKASFVIPLEGNHCVDRREEINAPQNFVQGGGDELMLVRACVVFDPLFPTTGLGARMKLDESGGYRLLATSAFVNEP